MLCTCPPWARAEFEAADSANLSAINIAVATYVSAIANNVNSIRAVTDENLPYLSTIKAELQTLRMSLGVTVPALLSELQAQGYDLKGILSDVDTISQHVGYIDDTLDRSEAHLEDIDRNTYESLEQLWYLNNAQESTTAAIYDLSGSAGDRLYRLADAVDNVDGSVDTLTEGISGQNAYAEDWGDLEEFAPADIDESVSPYDDGQTILDRASSQFQSSFQSFLNDIFSRLDLNFLNWKIEEYQSSLAGYVHNAPTSIALTPSMTVLGFNLPELALNWAPLKDSQLLHVIRTFVQVVLAGMFGVSVFRHFASVI